MDVHVLLHGQRFVWNERKASTNRAKHGVRFDEACEVFFDPFVKLVGASSDLEARDAAIGVTADRTPLFVVYVMLEADEIRLISARSATAKERRLYEDND